MKKLKVVVIGIGNMGLRHARVYSELENCNLVAVSDTDKTLIGIVNKYTERFYDKYKIMIDNEKPDIVSICVPTVLHYEIVEYCLSRGINVLVEKPITNSYKTGKKLLDLAKKKKVKLMVGHIERFNPGVRRVKNILENKELGKVITISIRRVGGSSPKIQDVDVALDLGIHDVDIANYLLNEIPTDVNINRQRSFLKRQDDSAEFFLKYKSGASVHIQTNWITPVKIRNLSITGTEGYLELDYIKQEIKIFKNNYEKLRIEDSGSFEYIMKFGQPEKTVIGLEKKEPLKEELSYFINCVQKNLKVDSQYALDALKICLIK